MPEHDWEKTNLVTKEDKTGMYDELRCRACGKTARRYGLSDVRCKGGLLCKKAAKNETKPAPGETPAAPGETKGAKTETPAQAGELRYLPLDVLIPTEDNVRTIRADDPKVRELRDSIAKLGVLVPVIARPHPTAEGKFDLRAGARRHMAAQLAGVQTIPVLIREMDDLTAMVVTVTENMEREDLTALEEARAVQQLLDAGFSVQDAAAQFGKSPSFVARRAALSRLAKCWREDKNLSEWPASWLERIAPLPAETQQKLYESDSYVNSLAQLESAIAEYTRELKRAKWPLDDPQLLAKAGACIECQKRSACQPGLFDIGFDADPKEIRKKDRCLDAECWEKKEAAYVERRKRELTAEHGAVTLVGDEPGMVPNWKIDRVKKDAKDAKACLDAHGELFWAKVKGEEKPRAAAAGRKNADGTPSRAPTGDAMMRASIAEAFASAHLAQETTRGSAPEVSLELAACAARVIALNGIHHGQGAREARDKLLFDLGLREKQLKTLVNENHAGELIKKTLAVGYFDLAIDAPKSKPELLSDVRNAAAQSFVVSAEFLACHLRADLSRVAVGLGLEANTGATKLNAIKAILDAKLPAGSLTPELSKAFGVKYSKPVNHQDTKKSKAKGTKNGSGKAAAGA